MKRIQRERTDGWRMPEGAVYVGPGTKWGNPYPVETYGREVSMFYYRRLLAGLLGIGSISFDELKGKDLCCWCRVDRQCHADLLLELAEIGSFGE